MREILFRGKRIDNSEWIEGSLINDGRCFIAIHPSLAFGPTSKDEINGETLWGFYPFFEVDPSTVGQYTGLTDKRGNKIFEGDIVHYIYDDGKENGWKADQNSIIKWDFSGFCMDGIFGSNKYACRSGWLENIVCNGGKFFEVIGNIHDNPDLLEVEP